MSSATLGLSDAISNYLLRVGGREDKDLAKLREETSDHPMAMMQISPEQGQFMALLVELIGAKKTLEIGVFTGYSSTVVAKSLPVDGKLIALDISEEFTAIARKHWEAAGVSAKIELILGPAKDSLATLLEEGHRQTFDFAFIDADKGNYDSYYELALALVRPGGIVAIDNVLWQGKVANDNADDDLTRAIRAFNQKLHGDQRVTLSMLTIGDGLTLALKR